MALDQLQQQTVAKWAREGVSLADIQRRISDEFGEMMTYMDVRFLVDDLKVELPPPPKPAEPVEPPAAKEQAEPAGKQGRRGGLFGFGRKDDHAQGGQVEEPAAGVSVEVDRIMKPGAMVSGSATFSDGNSAQWFIDEMGRLGFQPAVPGYKPSPEDIQEFQIALQGELRKLGYA